MFKTCFSSVLLLVSLGVWAQFSWYATDLRWDEDLRSHVGFTNPSRDELTFSLTGFGADGTPLGTKEIVLSRYARVEFSAIELFETGDLAWLKVDAPSLVSGYVRYRDSHGKDRSIVPLNHIAGSDLWVSQLTAFDEIDEVGLTIVNVSENEGAVQAHPLRQEKYRGTLRRVVGPVAIPNFGTGHSKTSITYPSLFEEVPQGLVWDRLFTDEIVGLAGIQHFSKTDTGEMATLLLPRTSFREMAIVPFHNQRLTDWTRFVLINTYNEPLEVRIIVYGESNDVFGLENGPTETLIVLEPQEKRFFDFGDHTDFALPYNPQWYRIIPKEGGLVGYQLFGSAKNGTLSAAGAQFRPGNLFLFPYTPTDAKTSSSICLVNPTDANARIYIYGHDDTGKVVARTGGFYLPPHEKAVYPADELFGDGAANVTWTRVLATTGEVAAFCLNRAADGSSMAAMQGVPGRDRTRASYSAQFELFYYESLLAQGWTERFLNNDFYRQPFAQNKKQNNFYDTHSKPQPGQFYNESAFKAEDENLFVGYEPIVYFKKHFFEGERSDTAAFLSPFFETPNYGDLYLSFLMRFHDPENATPTSRYGLVWRCEGDENWTWFGISGDVLLDPPLLIGDCWEEDVAYRRLKKLVTLTPWFPFEAQLPPEARGKRIQVGLFYDHQHFEDSGTQGPSLFIDNVRIRPISLGDDAFFFEDDGHGTVEEDVPAENQNPEGD